ncbi:MAG: AarF/ABC1/UbiB kinase family protein [Deltaproteobacteria bacterium]|nr:AarF/ABC1/UbiB kinase family protein [Deltaproteobacteria bacterium]
MMVLPLLVGAAALLIVVGVLWYRSLSRQRNAAGISTSLGGRTTQIGSLMTKRLVRRLWLRVRQVTASREQRQKLAAQYHMQTAAEAAQVLGNMKGVFMKLGQIMSFANDALPVEARAALQSLQKDAPPMAFALVRGVVESELGGDLGRFFRHFDEEPIAAASIGQVHRAMLKDGQEVAIKVQYPGVDEAISNDLKASDRLALMIDAVNKTADMSAVVEELKERMLDELDYRLEMQNQQLFARLWEGHPLIRIPRVYPSLCAKRVLCQEFKRGFGFYDYLEQANGEERRLAAFVIGDFVFESMFRHLVYNGDPHPGNYIFHEDGGISFIDFGCVKYFGIDFMRDIKRFFRAVIENDRAVHDEYLYKLGLVFRGRNLDVENMWHMWRYHLEPYTNDEVFTFSADYVARARGVMATDRLKQYNLPRDLLFFLRITFGLNAISQQLGASGNFHRAARRYFFDEPHPPGVATLGIRLPDKFMSSKVEPVERPAPASITLAT